VHEALNLGDEPATAATSFMQRNGATVTIPVASLQSPVPRARRHRTGPPSRRPSTREERCMNTRDLARRALLAQGGVAAAALALHRAPRLARAFPSRPGEEVLPWADQPAPSPVPQAVGTLLRWEERDAYLTPNGRFFTVVHDGQPAVDALAWRLEVGVWWRGA
jgi:hypothetical protein